MPVLANFSCSCLTWQQCRDANRAQEEWFGNAASFQDKTGLFDPQPPLTNHEVAFGAGPGCSLQEELQFCCLGRKHAAETMAFQAAMLCAQIG